MDNKTKTGRRRRDYHKKKYKNHLFANRESRDYYKISAVKWRKKILIVILAVVLIFWASFLIYSNYFRIEDIEVLGLQDIKETDFKKIITKQLNEKQFFIFPQNSIWLFSKDLAEKNIGQNYVLEELEIKKNLPNKLKFKIKEKISVIIWSKNDKYYHLDFKGIAISQIPEQSVKSDFPIVYDDRVENKELIKIGQEVISKDIARLILDISNKINAENIIKAVFFKFNKNGEIKVMTKEGWQIYFNLNQDVSKQVENLFLIIKKKIKDNRQNLDYIDLRFGEKIYYK